jgi:hypothetical protein
MDSSARRFLPPNARAGAHARRDHEGRVEGQGSLEPEWLGRLDQAGGFAEKLPDPIGDELLDLGSRTRIPFGDVARARDQRVGHSNDSAGRS